MTSIFESPCMLVLLMQYHLCSIVTWENRYCTHLRTIGRGNLHLQERGLVPLLVPEVVAEEGEAYLVPGLRRTARMETMGITTAT